VNPDELRSLLLDAVPPLPAPPDRLAEVGARVRRARARTVAAAALTVALLLGGLGALEASRQVRQSPAPAASPTVPVHTVLGRDGCPVQGSRVPLPSTVDTPGRLVPGDPNQVTLCETPNGFTAPGTDTSPRPLKRQVAQLVAQLNRLPDPDAARAALEAQHPGTEVHLSCTFVGYPSDLSFVFRYPDGSAEVVWLDRNCAALTSATHTRYYLLSQSPLDTFYALYRAQLRDTASQPPVPSCPAAIDPAHLDMRNGAAQPADTINRNRGIRDPFLPEPLLALAACRYAVGAGGATLVGHAERQGDLSAVRTVLNDATGPMPGQGTPAAPRTDCGWKSGASSLPELVDILYLLDATGATAEVRVWRRPCAALFASGVTGLVPSTDTVRTLDTLLGPAG
jgi:hypothetical protein